MVELRGPIPGGGGGMGEGGQGVGPWDTGPFLEPVSPHLLVLHNSPIIRCQVDSLNGSIASARMYIPRLKCLL